MKHGLYFKLGLFGLLLFTSACSGEVAFQKIAEGVGGICEENCIPGADYVVENFEQKDKASKVDILFVVDNSPSMMEEQKMLGSRFKSFISALNTVDWQIAFTTTDVSNGSYGIKGSLLDLYGLPGDKVLTADTPNAENTFRRTVQRSESNCSWTCPTSDEQGLLASIMAMEKSLTVNSTFFRPNVDLAIIHISDEDELSTGPRHATKPQDVIKTFDSLWGQTKSLAVYGLVIEPDDATCLREKRAEGTTAYYGTHVSHLAAITGGITGSLCETDYSETLEEISNKVRELVDSFELKTVPEGEVHVELEPAQNIKWRVEGNKLVFAKAPQQGTKIKVVYQRSAH